MTTGDADTAVGPGPAAAHDRAEAPDASASAGGGSGRRAGGGRGQDARSGRAQPTADPGGAAGGERPQPGGGERKRDADATRQALVEAAAALFAERGYDRTTVREIAARAGVNQALLFRYFGSKRSLFGVVMARGSRQRLRETPPELVLETALRDLLASGDAHHRDRSLEVFLRSAGGDDEAAESGRRLGEEYAAALAGLSDADDAALRSDLILAWLLGIGLSRGVLGKEPLASADPERVVRLMLDASRTLLERLP
ncbi:TetR/AcrR family transcriptional regulator [Streptomyces gamaensis]|uniref:TetR/AcrR family transcriptional regulator n=1 Tax=Streptomyces gamaensis TaxID=1763542 RepID=A0ABW0Z8X1_9ACTN